MRTAYTAYFEIHAYSLDGKLLTAAGVWLFHFDNIAYLNIHSLPFPPKILLCKNYYS